MTSTVLVASWECKQNFSVMRWLRTWLRASMTTERLSLLTLINIYREVQISYKRAVKIFVELQPRKLEVSNLVLD